MRRRAAEVTGWLLVLLALYVVLIGPVTVLEVAVGAVGALLAGIAARTVRTASGATPGGARHAARAVRAWPGAVLAETWQLAVAAFGGRAHRGRLHTLRLPEGVGAGWATAALSATPGTVVVDVDDSGERVVTVHRLGAGTSAMERALGAEEVRG
ncbi:Na+/H+ antiporter subunit E [Streptomyces sp. NPDC005722]